MREVLQAAYTACLDLSDGELTSAVPELARVSPDRFALAACTTDGVIETVGDADECFSLQSLTKPFVYAWALGVLGEDLVHRHVGVEPTGDTFDAVVTLDVGTHRPHNPMVNAGAIAVSGLFFSVNGKDSDAAMRAFFGALAGSDDLEVDETIFLSERAAAHKNRAIAYLLRHFHHLESRVDEVLDVYFRQCALRGNCRDLSVMAATLASDGVNPLTGQRVLHVEAARKVRRVMTTCGLYDASGRFAFQTGLPAKSGIGGGVLAVAPGRAGLAAFSPRLDPLGNSVRAVAALQRISDDASLHFLESRAPRDMDFRVVVDAVAELAGTRTERLTVSVCSVRGEETSAGAPATPFPLQAVANPLVYAFVSEWVGPDVVHARVGREPSGNPFHAIVFDATTRRPFNPLGNAGAIAVCSLVPGASVSERSARVRTALGALAGGPPLEVDPVVFDAERASGDRNHAIACLLRNLGHVDDEEAALELYLQNCSLRADCATLARMGATLAAGGSCPISGKRLLAPRHVRNTLSLMSTCGLHDASGRFACEVGIPAKTGISGAILAVVPGRLAIAVRSPLVDIHGSSIEGVAALKVLAERLDLALV